MTRIFPPGRQESSRATARLQGLHGRVWEAPERLPSGAMALVSGPVSSGRASAGLGMPMPSEPPGVPTPFAVHVHPYPTRFHGGQWVRPVFGMPWVRSVSTVFKPAQMYPEDRQLFVPGPGRGMPMPSMPPGELQAGRGVQGLGSVAPHSISRCEGCAPLRPAYGTHGGVFRRPRADGGGIFNSAIGEESKTAEASQASSSLVSGAVFAGAVAAGALLTYAILDRGRK